MDINFKCRHCEQDLSVDATAAGSEIQCPACGGSLIIPTAPAGAVPGGAPSGEPSAPAAAPKEVKHFVVPQRENAAAESLIAKPLKSLEASANDGIQLRTKCIRHYDCVEVGKDHFDDVVTAFVNKIGEANIIKIDTFNYAHRDLETRDWVTDYGVFILYRG